jgi:hypothetical protein
VEVDVNLPIWLKSKVNLVIKLRKLYSIRMPDPQNMGCLCRVVLKLYKFKEFFKIVQKFQVFKKKLPHINGA